MRVLLRYRQLKQLTGRLARSTVDARVDSTFQYSFYTETYARDYAHHLVRHTHTGEPAELHFGLGPHLTPFNGY